MSDQTPGPGQSPTPEEDRNPRALREWIETALIALAAWLLIMGTIPPFAVSGPSMEPTFYTGTRLLSSRVAYWSSDPQRGDIVVFRSPFDREVLVKRVIGLPGERITVRGGGVFIDGIALDEPYLEGSVVTTGDVDLSLDADEYFVMGDNRPSSNDSRAWGPLLRSALIGKAWLVYWPFDEIGAVAHETR